MPIFDDPSHFTRLRNDAKIFEGQWRSQVEAQRRKAGQDALELGSRLLNLFTVLPGATLAAQKAELGRLAALDRRHPRLAQLEAKFAAFEQLESGAQRGRARVARALEAVR